jgi:hypothetical protein
VAGFAHAAIEVQRYPAGGIAFVGALQMALSCIVQALGGDTAVHYSEGLDVASKAEVALQHPAAAHAKHALPYFDCY